MPPEQESWISVSKIAKHFAVCKDTTYAWLVEAEKPTHKTGRIGNLKIALFAQWVKSGSSPQPDNWK